MKLYAPQIAEDTAFPPADETSKGRLIFLNKRVWVAAEVVQGVITWIQLTNEIDAYHHIQDVSSDTWTVEHNLNTAMPVVQVYDDTMSQIIPDEVQPDDNNNLTISMGSAITDRSELQFAFEQSFTSASTVVIEHGLGYYPIVRVFIGTQEVQPASIIHDSLIQTTITFSSAQTGVARLI